MQPVVPLLPWLPAGIPKCMAGDAGSILVTVLGLIIGAVAFSGSMIAYGKLDGKVGDIMKPFMTYLNLALLIITLVLGAYIMASPNEPAEMTWAIILTYWLWHSFTELCL
jgi:H+-translocating NAD(P) transhydrogenase subunit beta